MITYYWPPSGGSGVQRWMFFSKYLPLFEIEPYVITVNENRASYKFTDNTLLDQIKGIKTFKTNTIEPLKFYSKIVGGDGNNNIPLGFSGEDKPSIFQKVSRFVRGNFFIPDARIGWNYFAYKKAERVIKDNNIKIVITTGPPHSTHLIGLKLKNNLQIKWIADFRDPWTEIYYNDLLYKTKFSKKKDVQLEERVLETADSILTIGPSMKELLQKKLGINKDKFFYVYNGYDEESFKLIKKGKLKDKFTICHIGIVSESQPITSLLKALSKAYDKNEKICQFLKLQFVGKISPEIISEIKETIPKIELEIIDYLPHKEALQYMVNADLLFNSLAEMKHSKLLISGKLMEYLATGNPIICLGDPYGDASELLKEFEYGKIFDRADIEGIYEFVITIFNKWKINTNFNSKGNLKYTRYETTKQLSEIIKNLI